jgi:hypothetical protein
MSLRIYQKKYKYFVGVIMKKNNFLFSCILIVLVVTFAINIKAQEEDNDKCSKILMETLSTLAVSNLFQTYLAITIMNDNYDNLENYEIFDETLFTLEKQLKSMTKHFDKFNKSKFLTKEDYEYIFQLKNINFLLREDIKLFREFLSSSDDDSYKAFFLNHTNVFKKLEELLQIEDFEGNGEEEQNEE